MMKDAEKANIAKLDRLIEETETIKHVHQAKKVVGVIPQTSVK